MSQELQFPGNDSGCRPVGGGAPHSGAGEPARGRGDLVRKERSSPFIELFRTTPPQTVCPNFYVLRHANGCAFKPACSYCYLKSSFPLLDRPRLFTNADDILRQVEKWIAKEPLESYVLNSGNLSDSLVFESIRPLMSDLVAMFRERAEYMGRLHTLLLVTKGGWKECEGLASQPPTPSVIISFSVNAPQAARQFERGASAVEERLEVARDLKRRGWRVRMRLDPMIQGFDYGGIACHVGELRPERVTLGTLRAEPSLIKFLPASLTAPLEIRPDGLSRYTAAVRMRLYREALDAIPEGIEIGLCEETPEIWERLLGRSSDPTCNCGL